MSSNHDSLIQERFALNRRRASGYGYLILGIAAIALAVAQLFFLDGALDIISWAMLLLLGGGVAVVGGSRVRATRRQIDGFEQLNGTEAGTQVPVGRP